MAGNRWDQANASEYLTQVWPPRQPGLRTDLVTSPVNHVSMLSVILETEESTRLHCARAAEILGVVC